MYIFFNKRDYYLINRNQYTISVHIIEDTYIHITHPILSNVITRNKANKLVTQITSKVLTV